MSLFCFNNVMSGFHLLGDSPSWFFFGPLDQFDSVFWTIQGPCKFVVLDLLVGGRDNMDSSYWLSTSVASLISIGDEVTDLFVEDLFDFESVSLDLLPFSSEDYGDMLGGVFAMVLSGNVSGLFPYGLTATAQIGVTLVLAGFILFSLWFHSFSKTKIKMFSHFLPPGSPLAIIFFIIVVEVISIGSSLISLSVRLFANMTSGHALLKILGGFAVIMWLQSHLWKAVSLFPTTVIFIISVLEFLIALLQAYVFLTLLLIYVSEQ